MNEEQKYISVKQAAEILSCTPKKVHELCDQGLVRRQLEGECVYIRADDIAELRQLDIIGEMRPGEMVRRLIMAEQEIRRLRLSVNLLFEVNNLAASRFANMTDPELLSLFETITNACDLDNWNLNEIDKFAELFIQVTEVEVDRINELSNIDNAWLPLLQLCTKLTRRIVSDRELSTNINLQKIHTKLMMGRKNLSAVALFFIEKAGVMTASRKLLSKVAMTDIEAFDFIAKQLKRTGTLSLVK